MSRRLILLTALACSISGTILAQTPEPLPRFVFDVRGASVGLPTAAGWTPIEVPDAQVPSRSLGLDIGGHARLVKLSGVTLGLGATLVTARGKATTEVAASTTGAAASETTVSTRLTAIAPQLSLNFGHRLGWSYLSVGFGQAKLRSEAVVPTAAGRPVPVDREWSGVLNYGAGARWFIKDRVGLSVDLRWHQLRAASATAVSPAAPRSTLFTTSIGVAFQ